MIKKDLIEKLSEENGITTEASEAVASAMFSYIREQIMKQTIIRRTMPIHWRTTKEAERVIILIGPRQCGKTTYIKMWKNRNKRNDIKIYDVEKRRSEWDTDIRSVAYENKFKTLVKAEIKEQMNTVTIIENGTFKTNEEYMQLIKLFSETAKIEFHFWRDKENKFEKPDPTVMCLVSGYHNISVREHTNRKAVKPNQSNDWRRNNKYT